MTLEVCPPKARVDISVDWAQMSVSAVGLGGNGRSGAGLDGVQRRSNTGRASLGVKLERRGQVNSGADDRSDHCDALQHGLEDRQTHAVIGWQGHEYGCPLV